MGASKNGIGEDGRVCSNETSELTHDEASRSGSPITSLPTNLTRVSQQGPMSHMPTAGIVRSSPESNTSSPMMNIPCSVFLIYGLGIIHGNLVRGFHKKVSHSYTSAFLLPTLHLPFSDASPSFFRFLGGVPFCEAGASRLWLFLHQASAWRRSSGRWSCRSRTSACRSWRPPPSPRSAPRPSAAQSPRGSTRGVLVAAVVAVGVLPGVLRFCFFFVLGGAFKGSLFFLVLGGWQRVGALNASGRTPATAC